MNNQLSAADRAVEDCRQRVGVDSVADAQQAVAFPSSSLRVPKVAILLCTYYGQHYLADQLESIAAQTHSSWEVWASDDGSQDNTQAILETYRDTWRAGRLSIHHGPAKGFVANFLSLACNASIEADYYAYSDQDDIWDADKLERAVRWLGTIPRHTPALYCSRTRLVDADNRDCGFSPPIRRAPCFANALMQNIGSGNTMVFNDAARHLLQKAGWTVPVATHDWWTYMAVTGCGGNVFYDTQPSLRYRQHDANIIGINSGWYARYMRVSLLWQGRFREWSDGNIEALRRLEDSLTPQSREILNHFSKARERTLIPRLLGFKRSGVFRQTQFGNLGLIAAVLFKKI